MKELNFKSNRDYVLDSIKNESDKIALISFIENWMGDFDGYNEGFEYNFISKKISEESYIFVTIAYL